MKEIEYVAFYLSGMKKSRKVSFTKSANLITAKQPIGKGVLTSYFVFDSKGWCSKVYFDLDDYAKKQENIAVSSLMNAIHGEYSWFELDEYKGKQVLSCSTLASDRVKDFIHDSFAAITYMGMPKLLGRRMGTSKFDDTPAQVRNFAVEGVKAKKKSLTVIGVLCILFPAFIIIGIAVLVYSLSFKKKIDELRQGSASYPGGSEPAPSPKQPAKPAQNNRPKPAQQVNPRPTNPSPASTDPSDFEFKLSDDGKYYSLAKYNGNDSIVSIPGTYHGKKVFTIDRNAFEGKKMLQVVQMPKGLFGIDNLAFKDCFALTTVKLNDDLKGLGAGVFFNCTSLKRLDIPASVELIAKICFHGCTNLTIYLHGAKKEFSEQWDVININTGEKVKKG